MKQFIKKISPKRIFAAKKDKKDRSIRSEPSSFSYGAASSSSSDDSLSEFHNKVKSSATPTSVLPETSGDWSDLSSEFFSEAFKLMDRDNDGMVSRTHLESLLTRLGANPPTQEEVATMLSEVDHDGDGCISVEALMSRIGAACDPAGDDEMRVAFEFFDTDHDGRITAEELIGVYKAIGDENCTLDECRRMIAEVDKNGDGFVCFEDFCRMMELQR
ncbi:probable calcium-binding protein CML36 [Mercurialis annua]|uniref:probable calcium-binding protein CML36 n=1 Tax=Mercurialis annua TaxID=3986 RepID=UPI00215DE611|nr:probable calcium-binding protein CML36 [Mercurialis annua]